MISGFTSTSQKINLYKIFKVIIILLLINNYINANKLKNVTVYSQKAMHIYGPCTFPKPFFQNFPHSTLEVGYDNLQQAFGTQVSFFYKYIYICIFIVMHLFFFSKIQKHLSNIF